MDLLNLFKRCLGANYTTTEECGDYAVKQVGTKLYLFFKWTECKTDWKNNFNFPAKPYRDMGTTWYCHRGFLKVWKSIEPCVKDAIMRSSVKSVTIVGYSHGGAIAALCHEYVWFNRPDLRNKLVGYGFGAPRVFWGKMRTELKERWANFHPVRNLNDIVAYLPPKFFGFRHVNDVIEVGVKGQFAVRQHKFQCFDAHNSDNYIYSMEKKNDAGKNE
jgi:hypothetical protein